jgi:hypothetical protein
MNLQKYICKFSSILFFFVAFSATAFSQFDQPVLQIGIGIVEPMGDMKGTYLNTSQIGFAQISVPDSNLFRNNYGAKTGFTIFGKGKINFDKYAITRGIVNASFSSFNSFETSKNGMIALRRFNPINNTYDTIGSSANFNYTFNNFSFGIGIEVAPLAFTKVVSPYFGASIAFNAFSSKLSFTETGYDTTSLSVSDFRIGVTFDAGIEAKISKMFGLALGVKFDLGNLLLKKTNNSVADRISWGKSNLGLNDDEGTVYSSIYNPVLTSDITSYNVKKKNINWGTIYLSLNWYFSTKAPVKKAPTKK